LDGWEIHKGFYWYKLNGRHYLRRLNIDSVKYNIKKYNMEMWRMIDLAWRRNKLEELSLIS
jgi:hypothetical protein